MKVVKNIKYEWAPEKEESNIKKHQIDFIFAMEVFLDEERIAGIDKRKDYKEVRCQTIGKIDKIILFVVYTIRDEKIRIISARKANKKERKKYFKEGIE